MRNKIIKGILFPTLVILIILSCILFIIPSESAKDKRVNGYKRRDNENLGVMLFGNSDLYSGFIPSILYDKYSITSYNCGKSKIEIDEAYNTICEAFKYENPDLIILETDLLGYKAVKKKDNFVHRAYKNHDFWRQEGASTIIDMKGYVFSSKKVEWDKSMIGCDEYKLKAFNENLDYVKKIESLCEEHNSKLLLVELPSGTSWTLEYHNAIEDYLGEINANFLDFNYMLDEIEFDEKNDSRDGGNHLNVFGAIKVTNYISDYINLNYEIRKDENNKSFEKASYLLKYKLNNL